MRWLALIALACLPAAQAALTLHVDLPQAELTPGTQTATALATVTLDCTQLLLRARGLQDSIPVQVNLTAPPTVTATGNPVLNLPTQPCHAGGQETQGSAPFTIGVTSLAPAHKPIAFTLTASLPADAQAGLAREEQTAQLQAAARAYLAVSLAGPQGVHLTQANQSLSFHFTNHGNAPVRIASALVFSTSQASAEPASLKLGSPAVAGSGPSEADLVVLMHAPHRGLVSEFTGQASFDVREDRDGGATQPLAASLFFRNEIPAPRSAPAPAAMLVGLALLGLACARRRA